MSNDFVKRPVLQRIADAPDLDRIVVCGWQEPSGGVAGYWWYEEDMCQNGVPCETTDATHWFPIITPDFPASPTDMLKTAPAPVEEMV